MDKNDNSSNKCTNCGVESLHFCDGCGKPLHIYCGYMNLDGSHGHKNCIRTGNSATEKKLEKGLFVDMKSELSEIFGKEALSKVSYKDEQRIKENSYRELVLGFIASHKEELDKAIDRHCTVIYEGLRLNILNGEFDVVGEKDVRATFEVYDDIDLKKIFNNEEVINFVFEYYIMDKIRDIFHNDYDLKIGFGCNRFYQFYLRDHVIANSKTSSYHIVEKDDQELVVLLPLGRAKPPQI